MSKGISPLIVTVLLVAATMSIAAILAYWASTFMQSTSPSENSSSTNCQFTDFQIYQCGYNSTSQTIFLTLFNYRTIPVTGLSATIFDSNNLPSWTNITLNGTLTANQLIAYSIPGIPSNFTKIVIGFSECPMLLHDTTCR